jgi:hypothetical protein
MKVVGTGLFLNLLASIGIFSYLLNHVGIHPAAMFFATFLIVWAFMIIGFIMLVAHKRVLGAVLITIGSLVFLPIGLVAIVGAILVARRKTAGAA